MAMARAYLEDDKRAETARELTNCDALNGGKEFIQRPIEKPRPSTTSKRIRPNHRDKESLLDELLELKNAIVDQAFHMRLHIQHHGQVQEKNNQLEKSIENLELAYGLEAPRVGGESKLIAKLLGLKACLREKQVICNSRNIEICLLRKDLRVTHCRELEIERDLFATEVGTLQKIIRGLRRIFVHVNSENDEIQRVQKKISKLESANKELENKITSTQKAIGDAKAEIVVLANQSLAAQLGAKSANSKLLELENHSQVLAKLKHQEECERLKLEHSILKMGDDTRQILKDKIAAEKQALYNHAQVSRLAPPAQIKVKAPEQPPDSPSGDAMAQFETEFIAEVEIAAVEFIQTVPASQPPSPKTEEQLKDQHVNFETRKEFFTEKVEDAEIRFLMAMEEIEYGKAQTKKGQSMAKKFAAAEKARLAAENERLAVEALAKKFEEDSKKAQEEVARLQAELEKLWAMGLSDKRWKSEKISINLGGELLKPSEYKIQVLDKGAEIDIDVDISSPSGPGPSSACDGDAARGKAASANRKKLNKLNSAKAKAEAEAEAKHLDEEMRKMQAEAKHLDEEMRKMQAEAKHLDEEMRKAQVETKHLDEEMRKAQVETKHLDEEMRKAQVETKHLDEEMRKAQAEAKRSDEEMRKVQAEAKHLDEEMRKAQAEAKRSDEEMRKVQAEAKHLDEEMRKAQAEAKHLDEEMRKAQAEAKHLDEEMKKVQAEAKHLDEEMRKVQQERDKLAAELAKLQSMGAEGKRWKNEIVSVVMDDKELSKDEYKMTVLDKGSQIDIDIQIQGISNTIVDELEKVKEIAGQTQSNLLDDDSSKLIKTNIEEVLQHLENISYVIKPKSNKAGPSKHDVSSAG